VGPLATLSVLPSSSWSVTLSAAGRTRFPTLKERFSTTFGTREPNPLLGPERAWNFALDVAYKPSRSLRVATGLFDSELSDLISIVVVRPGTEQMQNVDRARFIGVESEIRWAPLKWLDLSAGWMFLRARSGADLEQPVAYRPEHKGILSATVLPWPGIAITGLVRHVGPQDFQVPDTGVWGRLGAYQLLDARAEWAFHSSLRAWVRATNLTDANVEPRYSFPEAGRQLFFGLASQVGS
jgi:iron complex outermembrane receptor protein